MTPQFRLASVAVTGVAVLLGIGAALLWRHSSAPGDLTTGSYLSPRRALPDFSLIDQSGHAFGPKNLRGRWSFLYFGYTNCPDACPTTLTTLAAMEKRLQASGAAVRPQVVFVSVDAKRDTPAQLAKYVPYFDPEFLGVTAASPARHRGSGAKARRGGVPVAAECRRNLYRGSHGRDIRRRSRWQDRRDPHRTVHRGRPAIGFWAPRGPARMSGDDSRCPPAGRRLARPDVRRDAVPVAAARIVALGPVGHPGAVALVQELADPGLSEAVLGRHARGGADRPVPLCHFQRVLHSGAAARGTPHRRGGARHRQPGRWQR